MNPDYIDKINTIKIYFKGDPGFPTTGLNLTFQELINYIQIPNFQEFLIEFNELNRKKKVRSINNISRVIYSTDLNNTRLKQYFLLLYSKKGDKSFKREGILIVDHPEKGLGIIGLWPILTRKENSDLNYHYKMILKEILDKNENFQEILLIS